MRRAENWHKEWLIWFFWACMCLATGFGNKDMLFCQLKHGKCRFWDEQGFFINPMTLEEGETEIVIETLKRIERRKGTNWKDRCLWTAGKAVRPIDGSPWSAGGKWNLYLYRRYRKMCVLGRTSDNRGKMQRRCRGCDRWISQRYPAGRSDRMAHIQQGKLCAGLCGAD